MKMAPGRWPADKSMWIHLLLLVAGALLLAAGAFFAWQAWLIQGQRANVEQVHAAQRQAVRLIAREVARERGQIEQALGRFDPALDGGTPDAMQARLRQLWPQATAIEVYSASQYEVLHADYRRFGYAKAAQLMAATSSNDTPTVQMVNDKGIRRLSLVIPLGDRAAPSAWAWVEWPLASLQRRFESLPTAGGRLDLGQGDDRGQTRLLSHGAAPGETEDDGMPVPGTSFSVAVALPDAFIVLPRSVPLAALLALFGLGAGSYLLWRNGRDRVPRETAPEELLVGDVVRPRREPSSPAAKPPAQPPSARPDQIDPTIFRAYDIRGVVGQSLDRDAAQLIGQAIGTLMREKGLQEIVVGRDGRVSGPELSMALAAGLRDAGIDVIDVGPAPTPAIYFAAFRFNTGCAVSVTGSHNPPDYNGFKVVVGGETLSEEAIGDLYRRIVSGELQTGGQGGIRQVDVVPDYIERIVSDVQAERRLKVVVDCGNGIPGAVAPQVLEGIGCEVVPLYCDVDGSFPNHHPDPSDPKNLEDLILAVKRSGADLGVAFDGDGDRLGVVSQGGEIIYPDRLLMLFARDVLSRQPGATVIYDVKCTGHLKGQVLDAGGSPLMWRTGHSPIKAKMRETGAELAGEMSGHFFFKERWYGFDDGIYAAARLLEIIAGDLEERSPEEIFASCPKGVSTPELKIAMAEGENHRFVERFREQGGFGDATVVTIDGVRADWPDGWGLLRASNTTPALVLRFDADTPQALSRIQQVFREQIFLLDKDLKLPF